MNDDTVGTSAMDCWIEWKLRCAIGLCSGAAAAVLRQFAAARFRRFLSFYTRQSAVPASASPVSESDAWHLFESHLELKQTVGGKRYKDWLFARTELSEDDPLDVIQGGATLILRDVVREFLRRETSASTMESLNAPLGAGSDGEGVPFTLEDLLSGGPDPTQEVELREYGRLAGEHAGQFFADMTRRERIALLVRGIGLALSHPAVEKAAGCRKSMVNAAYHDCVKRMFERLTASYPEEDRRSVIALLVMIVGELKERLIAWGKSETACARLFLLVEGSVER